MTKEHNRQIVGAVGLVLTLFCFWFFGFFMDYEYVDNGEHVNNGKTEESGQTASQTVVVLDLNSKMIIGFVFLCVGLPPSFLCLLPHKKRLKHYYAKRQLYGVSLLFLIGVWLVLVYFIGLQDPWLRWGMVLVLFSAGLGASLPIDGIYLFFAMPLVIAGQIMFILYHQSSPVMKLGAIAVIYVIMLFLLGMCLALFDDIF